MEFIGGDLVKRNATRLRDSRAEERCGAFDALQGDGGGDAPPGWCKRAGNQLSRSPTSSYIGTWIVLAPSTLRSSAWACALGYQASNHEVDALFDFGEHQANWTTRALRAAQDSRAVPVVKARKSVEHCRYHQTIIGASSV